jgi:hypothetical protein
MEDPIINQMRVISDLQTKLAKANQQIGRLERTNASLEKQIADAVPVFRPKRHIKVRVRKNGEEWTNWGTIVSVVRKSQHLSCREIVSITGFERCAVYSAARRLGIKLKSASSRA